MSLTKLTPRSDSQGYRVDASLDENRRLYQGVIKVAMQAYVVRERLIALFMLVPGVVCSALINPRDPYDSKAYACMVPMAIVALLRAWRVDIQLPVLRILKGRESFISHEKDDSKMKTLRDLETRRVLMEESEEDIGTVVAFVGALMTMVYHHNEHDIPTRVVFGAHLAAVLLVMYHARKLASASDNARGALRECMPFIRDAITHTAAGGDDVHAVSTPFSGVRVTSQAVADVVQVELQNDVFSSLLESNSGR